MAKLQQLSGNRYRERVMVLSAAMTTLRADPADENSQMRAREARDSLAGAVCGQAGLPGLACLAGNLIDLAGRMVGV